MRVRVAKETRRSPPSSFSAYTPHWMQQSSANYSCYTRNAAVCLCGCGWAIDLARLAWNLGHRWWSSPTSPSWKQKNDTWEKPIEIVSSLLHICHGHGNGLCGVWTQCVPGECGQFQVGLLQTSLGNYWSCACVCLCVSEATPSQRVHLTFMRIQNWILANLWNFLVPTPRTEIWPTRLARLKCGANYV